MSGLELPTNWRQLRTRLETFRVSLSDALTVNYWLEAQEKALKGFKVLSVQQSVLDEVCEGRCIVISILYSFIEVPNEKGQTP